MTPPRTSAARDPASRQSTRASGTGLRQAATTTATSPQAATTTIPIRASHVPVSAASELWPRAADEGQQ